MKILMMIALLISGALAHAGDGSLGGEGTPNYSGYGIDGYDSRYTYDYWGNVSGNNPNYTGRADNEQGYNYDAYASDNVLQAANQNKQWNGVREVARPNYHVRTGPMTYNINMGIIVGNSMIGTWGDRGLVGLGGNAGNDR